MELRSVIERIGGVRFMVEDLQLQSAVARRMVGNLPYLRSAEDIRAELDRVGKVHGILRDAKMRATVDRLRLKMMQVKDIRGTVARVAENGVLDDIELFEVKAFAILACEIRTLLAETGLDVVAVPDLERVVTILDPECRRVPHFYIYDAYSADLAALRRRIKRLQNGEKTEESTRKLETAMQQHSEMEDAVRGRLSSDIHKYGTALADALHGIATLDILVAKAQQAIDRGLCKPAIADGTTRYEGLFHPQVREILTGAGKRYQAVDIEMASGPMLITGANMAGKTLMLKSVALAQALFQFGFYAPAAKAEIVPMDDILICMGDAQSELSGLSSFAAEMLGVDAIIRAVKGGVKALVLIDEPARTTNPTEGKAIVNAMLTLLGRSGTRALVTTHYSGITAPCRRMRVRGFLEEQVEGRLTVGNIGEWIDYSLVEDDMDTAPKEALRIARILGVDGELTECAERFLE